MVQGVKRTTVNFYAFNEFQNNSQKIPWLCHDFTGTEDATVKF